MYEAMITVEQSSDSVLTIIYSTHSHVKITVTHRFHNDRLFTVNK